MSALCCLLWTGCHGNNCGGDGNMVEEEVEEVCTIGKHTSLGSAIPNSPLMPRSWLILVTITCSVPLHLSRKERSSSIPYVGDMTIQFKRIPRNGKRMKLLLTISVDAAVFQLPSRLECAILSVCLSSSWNFHLSNHAHARIALTISGIGVSRMAP